MCIGCGLCTTRCKFDAIHLHKEFDEYGVDYKWLVPNILRKDAKKAAKIAKDRTLKVLGQK